MDVGSGASLWLLALKSRQALRLPSHHQTAWTSFQSTRRVATEHAAYPITAPRLAVDTTRPLYELVESVVGWLERLPASRG